MDWIGEKLEVGRPDYKPFSVQDHKNLTQSIRIWPKATEKERNILSGAANSGVEEANYLLAIKGCVCCLTFSFLARVTGWRMRPFTKLYSDLSLEFFSPVLDEKDELKLRFSPYASNLEHYCWSPSLFHFSVNVK